MKDHSKPTSPFQIAGLRVARPRLLMLSHCVPGSTGDAARRRSWQLLDFFSRTHDVRLACLADGAVSLTQWRALHGRTKQIVIEPVARLRRWAGRVMRWMSRPAGESFLMQGRLTQPIREWAEAGDVAAVLCTHAALLQTALLAGEAERFVDLVHASDLARPQVVHVSSWIIRDPAQAALVAAQSGRTMLIPDPASRDQTPIRLVTDGDDAPIALPAAALHKAA